MVICAGLLSTAILIAIGGPPGPAVIRVVGDDEGLWAYTRERTFLQGTESTWWLSRDGGRSWSGAPPPTTVVEADLAQEACNTTACYRLVEGRIIERRAIGGRGWVTEHERPLSEVPRPVGDWRRDWDEQRSIAAGGDSELDTAAVAAGHGGVLVRSANASWHEVAITHPWEYRIRWWLVGIACTIVMLVGVVVELLLRRSGWPRPTDLLPTEQHQPEEGHVQ